MVAQFGRALRKTNPVRGFNSSFFVRDAVVVGSNPVHRCSSIIWDTYSNAIQFTRSINPVKKIRVLNKENVTHTAISVVKKACHAL